MAAAEPAVTQPSVRTTRQQKVGQILREIRQCHRRSVAATRAKGVHHRPRLRGARWLAKFAQVDRARGLLHQWLRASGADLVVGPACPEHLRGTVASGIRVYALREKRAHHRCSLLHALLTCHENFPASSVALRSASIFARSARRGRESNEQTRSQPNQQRRVCGSSASEWP